MNTFDKLCDTISGMNGNKWGSGTEYLIKSLGINRSNNQETIDIMNHFSFVYNNPSLYLNSGDLSVIGVIDSMIATHSKM